ncbi:hypothetical protein LINPERPRIM_LOCUS24620, partial [Linum perenne]
PSGRRGGPVTARSRVRSPPPPRCSRRHLGPGEAGEYGVTAVATVEAVPSYQKKINK